MTNRAFNLTMALAISLALWGLIVGVARIAVSLEQPAMVMAHQDDDQTELT